MAQVTSTQQLKDRIKQLIREAEKEADKHLGEAGKYQAKAEALRDAMYDIEKLIEYQSKQPVPVVEPVKETNKFNSLRDLVVYHLTHLNNDFPGIEAWKFATLLSVLNKSQYANHQLSDQLFKILETMLQNNEIEIISKHAHSVYVQDATFQWVYGGNDLATLNK